MNDFFFACSREALSLVFPFCVFTGRGAVDERSYGKTATAACRVLQRESYP